MSAFSTALDHVSEQIIKYRKTAPNDGNTLVEINQQITSTLFYLEKERAAYHAKFQQEIADNVKAGDSVSRAENKAHLSVPEMYLLRRIMDSAYTVCDSIRTQVSWIKSGIVNV
jgi:hypothetical protein